MLLRLPMNRFPPIPLGCRRPRVEFSLQVRLFALQFAVVFQTRAVERRVQCGHHRAAGLAFAHKCNSRMPGVSIKYAPEGSTNS